MSRIYGVYGASGFGQETMDWFRRQLENAGDQSKLVFVDDQSSESLVSGVPVISYDKFLTCEELEKQVVIAIASGAARERIDLKLQSDGIPQASVRGQYTFVRGAVLGEGSVLSAFVDITANVVIGRCFQANTYSYVGHDCRIGDYVTFAPRVSCNGNVVIEDHAYIGTGAILRQGKPGAPLVIGRGAVVGMGAVVTKSVPPGVTVVGNPARVLQR